MNVALCAERLNLISLCTGGGGLDLGVELAMPGARSVALVEREAFAVAHLVAAMQQGLLDEAPVWSDVRTFDGRPWRGAVDGLIGGIPCQGHSLAGKKRGQLDPRDLWSPARRIIVQARPWFVLIENVGGILSPGEDAIAGAERVWRDLSGLGFVVEAGLFTAAEIGAPHQRERWFCLAVADAAIERERESYHPERAISRQDSRKDSRQDSGGRSVRRERIGMADANCGESSSIYASDETHEKNARPLQEFVGQWMTPRVSETGQYQYNKGNKDDPVLTLQGQAQASMVYSLPDRPISTVGDESSPGRRTLNPQFVGWLMGWPPGFTRLALNSCACSATALSAFKRRMRCELYALGLSGEAAPAQLGLFQ